MPLAARVSDLRRHQAALLTAVVGVAAYAVWQPPTADLSNQEFRAAIFGQAPWAVWNNRWFAGHHTPSYSLLSPPLGWLLGPVLLGVLAALGGALASSLLTHRLARADPTLAWPGPAAALLTVGLLSSLYGGRTAFLLGATLGLWALLAAAGDRRVAVGVLGLASAAASPVAGLFLVIIGGALWLARGVRRSTAAAMTLPPLVLIGLVGVLFPDPGTFPFPLGGMLNAVAAAGLAAVAGWRYLTVRWACAGYAALCVAVTLVPTPVGGNAARLAALAVPAMVVLMPLGGAAFTTLLLVPLTVLQWSPVSLAVTGDTAQTEARFYAPLVEVLDDLEGPVRVEVVPVASHDEANHVGQHHALARGWNRQLDRAYHDLFHGQELTAEEYRDWLVDNGVAVVAIADTELDLGGELEAELLADPPDYLQLLHEDETWRVFLVEPRPRLASSGAELTELGNDSFTLDVATPGALDVKVRFSPWFAVVEGVACVERGDDGWTVVRADEPGRVVVRAQLSMRSIVDRDGDC